MSQTLYELDFYTWTQRHKEHKGIPAGLLCFVVKFQVIKSAFLNTFSHFSTRSLRQTLDQKNAPDRG